MRVISKEVILILGKILMRLIKYFNSTYKRYLKKLNSEKKEDKSFVMLEYLPSIGEIQFIIHNYH